MGSQNKVIKIKQRHFFYLATISASLIFLIEVKSLISPFISSSGRELGNVDRRNIVDSSLHVRSSTGVGLIAQAVTSTTVNILPPQFPFTPDAVKGDSIDYERLSLVRKKYDKELTKYQNRKESGTAEEEYPRITWETPIAPRLTTVYASPEILAKGCSITVVFLDPRIPAAKYTDSTWYMLESVAEHVGIDDDTVCVTLQTSSCVLQKDRSKALGINLSFEESAEEYPENLDLEGIMSEAVYRRSFPLFRKMLEKGQVRLNFIDHEKYHLPSCSDYYPPNGALMNMHYWRDEFLDDIDSDLVLYVQKDSVLCHTLDPNNWRDISFVGGPFPGDLEKLNAKAKIVHKQDICKMAPKHWKHFTRDRVVGTNSHLPLELTDICGNGRGLVGNGGLSLRSRAWMSESIMTCPHFDLSGLHEDLIPAYCNVNHDINEDSYFSIILNAIDAPLVIPWEAALFSLETYWADKTEEIFGDVSFEEKHGIIAHRWGKDGLNKFHQMHNAASYNKMDVKDLVIIPIGMHKPWLYHSPEVLKSPQVEKECPLFKYIHADHMIENTIF
mmetsp:Transcript_61628/g.74138  ORF Transcript_61628/g.74138 Transcript_61628/m.74138 type:complete len:557 (-) Transcript_61628:17-1687(-)